MVVYGKAIIRITGGCPCHVGEFIMNNGLILAQNQAVMKQSQLIIRNGHEIVSNVVASQIESHKRFGGVVPEIASRHHVEQITMVIEEALAQANLKPVDLDAVAVTEGPGLVGHC